MNEEINAENKEKQAGDEDRKLTLQVPAPAVRPMKRRVISCPGAESLMCQKTSPDKWETAKVIRQRIQK